MKNTVLAVLFLVSSGALFGQTWTLDKDHSKLGFGITHLMISNVEGSFKAIDGKITSSKEDFSDAVIEFTADVNTINTDNDQRDTHLKAEDYFDAAKYPTITFKSKSFKKIADKKYKVTGDLTMHGVTKPVELTAVFNGTAVHPYTKKTLAGFKVTGTVKRTEFAISAATPAAMLSDEVAITANTEFVKN